MAIDGADKMFRCRCRHLRPDALARATATAMPHATADTLVAIDTLRDTPHCHCYAAEAYFDAAISADTRRHLRL